MRRILAHPVFGVLFVGHTIGMLATGLATIALGLVAYSVDDHRVAAITGTALAVKMVAYVLVSPMASATLGGLAPKTVLVGANIVRIAAAVAMTFVTAEWQIYVLIFALQAASACFTPTMQAMVPRILPDPDDYTQALSLTRLSYDLEQIMSPMVAAAVLVFLPGSALFCGTAAGLAASSALLLVLRLPAANPSTSFSWWQRATRGMRLLATTPTLRPILAINAAVASAGALVIIYTVVFAKSRWGLGDDVVALMFAASGTGSMVVALVLPHLLKRLSERSVMLTGVTVLPAAVLATLLALPVPVAASIALVAGCWMVIGAAWSACETPVGRLIAAHVDEADRPAAFAAQFALSHACWLVTYPLAGWLGTWRLDVIIIVLGGVCAVCTAGVWRLWPRQPA